jgi:hypothetical protein
LSDHRLFAGGVAEDRPAGDKRIEIALADRTGKLDVEPEAR